MNKKLLLSLILLLSANVIKSITITDKIPTEKGPVMINNDEFPEETNLVEDSAIEIEQQKIEIQSLLGKRGEHWGAGAITGDQEAFDEREYN